MADREDQRDDGTAVFQVVGDELIVVDPETGECERYDDALDIQSFDIDIAALCRAIREQSGLKGPGPVAISARIWRLGRHEKHGRTAEICLVRRLREENSQEIVDHVRGAIDSETPVALISLGDCDLPTAVARQLDGLRLTVTRALDLLRDDPDRPFALDLGRVRVPTGQQAPDARLQIDRIGRRVIFEGIEIDIEPRDFDAFALLAEEAMAAGGWVSKEALAATLQASTGRESNPEQVDRCINRLRDAFRKNKRLDAVPSNGFIDRKSKVGARLDLASSGIAFIA
ncbi:hypothetical protein [Hyphomicrobium sp.]|uniref:hypothetical protein n=1 Tax=Hyphomicrobium sp. TaxID=82 RepID=UPI002FE21C50